MPFVPFTKSSPKTPDAPSGEPSPTRPVFSKTSSKRRRKTGKVAPAQKALMSGRSLSGGGR